MYSSQQIIHHYEYLKKKCLPCVLGNMAIYLRFGPSLFSLNVAGQTHAAYAHEDQRRAITGVFKDEQTVVKVDDEGELSEKNVPNLIAPHTQALR